MNPLRRVAVLGGTFDPVHNGHLHVARAALERFAFDELRFLPAAAAPHKTGRSMFSGERRVELLRAAIAGEPRFSVETCEMDRGQTAYTIDTLAALAEREPHVAWFFVIGADSLSDLPGWRRAAELVERFTFVTVPRDPGVDRAAILAPAERAFPPAAVARLRFHVVSAPPVPISSPEIRARLAERRAIDDVVPGAVARALAAQRS